MTRQSTTQTAAEPVSPIHDRIAMVLMLLLSAMSVYVAIDSFLSFGAVAPNSAGVEAWRMFGYVVFAGLFALVGLLPRRMTGIWELILFHKAGTAVFLMPYMGTDEGASITKTIANVVWNDLMLVAVTATAYVLAKGWRAWNVK